MANYFQTAFLGYRRQQWLRSIVAVEVQASGTWYRGDINTKTITGDTLTITATFPQLDSSAASITASRLIDARGEVAAIQSRSISKAAGQGLMIKITIPVYEVTS